MRKNMKMTKSLCSLLLSLAMVLSLVANAMISVVALEAPTEPVYTNRFETLENTQEVRPGGATEDQQYATLKNNGGLWLWRFSDGSTANSLMAIDNSAGTVADGTVAIKYSGKGTGSGVLFRYVDEKNYMYATLSWDGSTLYLFEFLNGELATNQSWSVSDVADAEFKVSYTSNSVAIDFAGQTFDGAVQSTAAGRCGVIFANGPAPAGEILVEKLTVETGEGTYVNKFFDGNNVEFINPNGSDWGKIGFGGNLALNRAPGSAGNFVLLDTAAPKIADGSVSVGFAGHAYSAGVILRCVDADNCIYAWVNWNARLIYLVERVNGVARNVVENLPIQDVAYPELKVVLEGTSYDLYWNGELKASGSDLTLTSGGYCGVLKADQDSNLDNGGVARVSYLTVVGTAPAEPFGYKATMTVSPNAITVGETVAVSVDTNNDFASAEIEVEYDAEVLKFVSTSLGTASDNNGTVTVAHYGDDADQSIVLTFEAIKAAETTEITLTSAGFSTEERAATEDLLPATGVPASVEVAVAEKTFNVGFEGSDTWVSPWFVAADGGELPTLVKNGTVLTFKVSDYFAQRYNVTEITVKDSDKVVSYDEETGLYSVTVDGDLTLVVAKTEMTYDVVIPDDYIGDNATKATFGTDYVFTAPEGKAPTTDEDGYEFIVTITIGGQSYTPAIEGDTYTIAGDAILGEIAISVEQKPIYANSFSVSVEGDTDKTAGTEASSPVKAGENAVLTITVAPGYKYTVTATMGGVDVTVAIDGNTYTVEGVTGSVVFTIAAELDGTIEVEEYLTLKDGKTMWLVLFKADHLENKTYTYREKAMYWSEKYEAYCVLIIDVAEGGDGALAQVDGTAKEVVYNGDVNMANAEGTVIDANDAQLVYNMYNVAYEDFSDAVTMEKFLRADMNEVIGVNTADAAAIVNIILQ